MGRIRRFRTVGMTAFVGMLVVALFAAPACQQGGGGSGGEQPSGRPIECGTDLAIVNIPTNIPISSKDVPTLSVVYNAAAEASNLRGYYVPVSSSASNATETGPQVIVAENLPTGSGQSFIIPLSELSVGFYRAGLRAGSGNTEVACPSAGTIEIVESSLPVFTLPNQNTEVTQGEQVQVDFNLNDPTNQLFWRLFYVDSDGPFDVPADEIGTQIRTGQGESDVILWNTGSVAADGYLLGLSTTDSGQSVAETVAAGDEDRVRTILNPFIVTVKESSIPSQNAPLLDVTQPSFNVNALLGEAGTVNIAFKATIRVAAPVDPSIRVFYDQDGRVGTGDETTIESGLPPTATAATLQTQPLAEGSYFVGVTVADGVNPPLTVYARGKVAVSPFTLEVTAPDFSLPVKPGSEVVVEWNTNITPEVATVDVFRKRVDGSGNPTGAETVILAPTKNGATSATFVATESGLFQVTVRYKFDDASKPELTDNAPQSVRVSGLPLQIYTGDLAEFTPSSAREEPRGVLFEGHQFEDNAGSSFVFGDFNDDGLSDVVVSARYGKPQFFNPTGLGVGEAYLFRGSEDRYSGSINLNSVGSTEVPGLILTGPASAIGSGFTTQGLSSMFVSSDADGDGIGELWFGFPFTSTVRGRQRDIETDLQFEHGGVVVVSSQNSLLRGGSSDTTGARMELGVVGLNFEQREVAPEPDQGVLCANGCSWLADFYSPNPGACPVAQNCPDTGICEDGTGCPPGLENACLGEVPFDSFVGCLPNILGLVPVDNEYDSLIEPKHGFESFLAINFINHYQDVFGAFPCTDARHQPDGPPFPCPSCHSDSPFSSPGCGCSEWSFNLNLLQWEPSGDELCASITGDIFSGDPLALFPPPPDCNDQVQLIQLLIGTFAPLIDVFEFGAFGGAPINPSFIGTGFFSDRVAGGEESEDVNWNDPLEPTGARIVGRPTDTSHEEEGAFGTSIAQSGNEMIISAPARDAVNGADIGGLLSPENENSGLAYLFSNEDLWTLKCRDSEPLADTIAREGGFRIPPKPHIYAAGGGGHTGFILGPGLVPPGSSLARLDVALRRKNVNSTNLDVLSQGGLSIAGRPGENIQNILGIPDFNRDTRPDFVVGAPTANSGDGALYVAFRRPTAVEGDYVLDKLTLSPSNLERLAGVYVTAQAGSGAAFGASLAGGIDFNSNGIADVAIGAPHGNSGTGEVVIVFASNQLTSPEGGVSVQTLLNQRQAARITGAASDSQFGFNVANAGDIDGDGINDLLIAAPGATPMFDANPNDATDELTTKGIDRNLDGVKDDVTGPKGIPDGVVDALDNLEKSGLVYVVFGSSDARKWATTTTGPYSISISKLGSAQLPGFIIAGRRADDLIGGGDATTVNPNKTFGRSAGLAGVGDVDGDGLDDFMVGSILADPRVDPQTGVGTINAGEAYLIYGFEQNAD